nr:MAG TPA: hypothetical protein [Caudoviricetes sp.]
MVRLAQSDKICKRVSGYKRSFSFTARESHNSDARIYSP